MQLFHIDADKIQIKWNNLEVFPIPKLISQLRKVLRIQKWDKICIQYSENDKTTRLELSILDRTDKNLEAEIISSKDFELDKNNVSSDPFWQGMERKCVNWTREWEKKATRPSWNG